MSIVTEKSIVLCAGFLLMLIPFGGLAFDIDLEIEARPACNQYCDDINAIPIFYTRETDPGYVEYLERGIKGVVKEKGYSEKIDVLSVERPASKKWYPRINNKIAIELNVGNRVNGVGGLVIGVIRMMTPSGSYHDVFVCEHRNGGASNCVRDRLDEFLSDIIEDFVFDQSIID